MTLMSRIQLFFLFFLFLVKPIVIAPDFVSIHHASVFVYFANPRHRNFVTFRMAFYKFVKIAFGVIIAMEILGKLI